MLSFRSPFIEALPGDPLTDVRPRQVYGALWSKAPPTPVAAPRLVTYSREVAEELGLTEAEPGAIVCRVAPTFVRFGNFELCTSRGDVKLLKALADYVITGFFPELGPPSKQTYAAFFREVARRTAKLIAHWQAVGFVH